ncbi:hypothetical protein HYV88_03745 [Candidatus Woesearchaeota archaeon]|nr:hypothetical protein [Candidatus Woesearchaeota archaeon]
MTFFKTFPRTLKGGSYPVWEEVVLSDEEEKKAEIQAREENISLMKDCIDEAKKILAEKGFKFYQSDVVNLAISIFDKIASHQVYYKENKAKEKFDEKFKNTS